jgi:hypothetical protein
MALTAEGTLLSAAHREGQIQLRSGLVRQLLALWPALDPTRLDATFDGWSQAVNVLVNDSFNRSAGLASSYLSRFRASEIGAAGATVAANALPADQVFTSLRVTGPIAIQRLVAGGMSSSEAATQALVLHTGAASRLAMLGGRHTIDQTVDHDHRALGFARVTSFDPCFFCAMLASRGPVYKTERRAIQRRNGRRYHDHCACFAEPVYSHDAEWPGRGREFRDIWNRSTAGLGGDSAIRAFRRALAELEAELERRRSK